MGEGVEVAALGALEGAEVVGGVAVGRIHLDWILINLSQGVAVGMPFLVIIVNNLNFRSSWGSRSASKSRSGGLKKKLLIGAAVGAGAYVAYKVDPRRICTFQTQREYVLLSCCI